LASALKKGGLPGLVLLVLLGALMLPSAASAASRSGPTVRASFTHRQQDALIRRTRRSLAAVRSALGLLTTKESNDTKSLSDRIGVIERAAPSILGALTTLGNAATQLANGLTTVGSGLTTLGTAYQSVEYGVAGVFDGNNQVGGSGATLTSADIPDDGNPAQANGSLPYTITDSSAHSLDLRASIRSNEADVQPGGDPTGQVGGVLYVKCATPTFAAPTPPFTSDMCGGGVHSGDIVCTAGPTPASSFSLPDGSTRSLQLVNIEGTTRTNTSEPSAADQNVTGAHCTIPGGGAATPGIFEVTADTSFVDLPTSLTPGPAD
jgi:hypothetical protein